MKTQIFLGKIIERDFQKHIQWNSPLWVRQQINKFNVGTNISAYITNKKLTRSQEQNRLLWLYNSIIRREIDDGYTDEELHELFKKYCMPEGHKPYKKIILGKEIWITKSTKNLSKDEFAILLLNIEEFTGIALPDTSEYSPTTY